MSTFIVTPWLREELRSLFELSVSVSSPEPSSQHPSLDTTAEGLDRAGGVPVSAMDTAAGSGTTDEWLECPHCGFAMWQPSGYEPKCVSEWCAESQRLASQPPSVDNGRIP